MTTERQRPSETLDPLRISVHLSDDARRAFGDLAAAVHFSDHFDPTICSILEDMAAGKRVTVGGMLCALPEIASETFKHLQATGDERVAEAWHEVSESFSEFRYTLSRDRHPDRGRLR
jgi:hypothetical protein